MATQRYRLHTKIQETVVYFRNRNVNRRATPMAAAASDEDSDETDEEDSNEIPELQYFVGACGFMELVIHHILYVKNVFPKEIFRRSQRNGIPFWICVHPDIWNYILNFLDYADKCLTKLKKLEILFVLVRRKNKEVLEEFYFELKPNASYDESDSKLVCHMDHLVAICEDIQNSNTFTDFNAVHSGKMEITFELVYLLNMDIELPEQDSNIRWISYHGTGTAFEENTLRNIIPFKSHCNKKYEIKAYAIKGT